MNGLPYYKAYPRDFIEGTIGMDFETKAAYRLILDLIYMQGGALNDDPRYISGLLGCSMRKWSALRAGLVESGKIQVRGEHLGNYRADIELETLAKLQEKQRENRSRPNKNKEIESPRCDHTEPDTDTEEEKIPEAKASGRDASDDPSAEDDDFAKQLFDRAVAFLGRHGTPDRQARSIVGRWRKDHKDPAIFDAFTACHRAGVVDPIPWITARLGAAPAVINLAQVMELAAQKREAEDRERAERAARRTNP